jgi:hypothetical protein
MIHYRKTKTGQWVAYGPAAEVATGEISITKADGTLETRTVASVGRSFAVDGSQMVYGYLTAAERPAPARTASRPARAWWDSPRERRLAAADGDPGTWS